MNFLGFPGPLREVVQRRIQQLQPMLNTLPTPHNEDTVGLLSDKEPSLPEPTYHRRQVSRKLGIILALLGVFALLATGLGPKYKKVEDVARKSWPAALEDHYLHVVIPAQSSNTDLCRTMLAGFVLRYPPPWIAIPKSTLNESGHKVSATVQKLESILEFLEHDNGNRDNDTAIILANPNTWFQIRPEVLLKRYMNIQYRHDLELLESLGNETVITHSMKSKALFATNSACPSIRTDDCRSVLSASGAPRYLSHDFTMGQVKDLTSLYRHAVDQARSLHSSNATFDESSIFGDLFQYQESDRQSLAMLDSLHTGVELTQLDQKDFGIAIDLEGELSHLMTDDDVGDSTWTKPDFQLDDHSGLPKDIAMSAPPYWTVTADLPSKTWKEVPLLVVDQKVPAFIQRRPGIDPELSHAWYERLWFHPYARALLDSEVLTSIHPLARLVDPRTGIRQRFWAQGIGKASVKTVDVEIYQWSDVCGDARVAEEVFLDGKGMWQDPRL